MQILLSNDFVCSVLRCVYPKVKAMGDLLLSELRQWVISFSMIDHLTKCMGNF